MIRKIISIDSEKCNGCGACAEACHEGAIGMAGGKARLLCDDYCDGLGDCLPACPVGAITFTEREAAEYDEAAVREHKRRRAREEPHKPAAAVRHGCPGSRMHTFARNGGGVTRGDTPRHTEPAGNRTRPESQLGQWPCQIKLVPVNAPYFEGAKLLVAADCSAFAYGDFHGEFMKGKITLIGCPKLDGIDYSEKLAEIIRSNEIKSVTVVRMEVPCCGGLEAAAKNALQNSGKFIPWEVATISIDGTILDD